MPLSVGASPDDVERLTAMLRVVGRFGHQLGAICDQCVTALGELAPPATGDDEAQRRAEDDGWPPTD